MLAIQRIDEALAEVQERMRSRERDIADFGEALGTLDLDIDEKAEIEEYLDEIMDEWKQLKDMANLFRMQRSNLVPFALAQQNSPFEFPEVER